MRVLHVGGAIDGDHVDGHAAVVAALAKAQGEIGTEVGLLHYGPQFTEPQVVNDGAGPARIQLPEVPHRRSPWLPDRWLEGALDRFRPDLVHLHSVFSPTQVAIARTLARHSIPYIVRPAGGLSPRVLERARAKKALFLRLFERNRLMRAAAIVGVTPAEVEEIRAVVPAYRGLLTWVPNPIPYAEEPPHWQRGRVKPNRVVWLGRYDVHQKGLDLLAAMATDLPRIEFVLHGVPAKRDRAAYAKLAQDAPDNVRFAAPVFGSDKQAALLEAAAYVHPSRWEAFGVSIGEALALGVPVAVSSTCALAPLLAEHGAAEILAPDPATAARSLGALLADHDRQAGVAAAGARFASAFLAPREVARRWQSVYADALTGPRRS